MGEFNVATHGREELPLSGDVMLTFVAFDALTARQESLLTIFS